MAHSIDSGKPGSINFSTRVCRLYGQLRRCGRLLATLSVLFCLSLIHSLPANALEQVTLQLKWKHQFQFAGYYAAKHKGYYRDAGLDVELRELTPGRTPTEAVLDGSAQYGIDISRLLLARKEGKPVVALAAIFQHSPYILIARNDGAIRSVHSLVGKRIMFEDKADDIRAYLLKEGAKSVRFTSLLHTFNLQDLIDGKADAITAYSTNEPFYLDSIGFRYDIYSPRSAGIDFYGDTLFTTDDELKRHPKRVKAFHDASLRGWKYAMANPEEMVDLIIREYAARNSREHLLFEAMQMRELIQPELVEMGYMNPGRWRHIADTYAELGLLPRNFSLEGFIYSPDGKQSDHRWIFMTGALLAALLGVSGIALALKKVIRLRTAELALSNDRLLLATKSAKMGVWDWDVVSNTMFWDARMIELYGYTRDSFPGGVEAWQRRVHPEDRDQTWSDCQATLRGEADFNTIFRIVRPDGTILHIKADGMVLRNDDGAPVRMLGINYDITDRKQAEVEKEKLEVQLHQAQKMESVGRLAGGVAHDFNNMLGVILGYTELAMERVEPDNPLHANLEKIQEAAQRSGDLTRQLLAFARKQTVSPKVIDLNDTIESILNLLRRLIGEDIDLAWQPGKEVWPVKIDPTQVDQILTNLCVNARDAIVDTGKVTIETGTASFDEEYCAHHAGFVPGEYVLLAVSDTGCGMDEVTQAHVFEPFFTTKEMGKGTGLGLATVYGVVKQNNGFINVYSEPGQGTTFKVYLPRHFGKTVPLPEKGLDNPGERGHETVLLVEDEPAILEMTTGMLEKLGYTVLAAGTPGEAIRLAQEYPGRIDLLLTDVVMPEMNGRDLAKNLLTIYPDIRRLFMSGYTANVIAHRGVLDEGVHFIQKPFSMKDLGEKLREALKG